MALRSGTIGRGLSVSKDQNKPVMLQQIVVLLVFLGALGYLGYRSWQSLRRPDTGGCAKGCGCDTAAKSSSSPSRAKNWYSIFHAP